MAREFEAYIIRHIKVSAMPTPGEKLALMFIGQDGPLFSCNLELEGCDSLAEACAETIAASDWKDIWERVPNPSAAEFEEGER